MEPRDAIARLHDTFPFPGYVNTAPVRNIYLSVVNKFLQYVPRGSKVLDFGCGPCDKAALLQFLGYRCSGFDDLQDDWHRIPGNRRKIIDFAEGCGIDIRLPSGHGLPFERESFDIVTAMDVIEHLHESPREQLNDLLELVKPEGLLFITVPNAVNIRKRIAVLFGKTNLPRYGSYYWYPGAWRGHVREYVKDDLALLAQYLNLEVVELNSCDHILENVPARVTPLYLAITDIIRGWKDSWLLIAKKKPGWTPRRTLPRDELVEILGKYTDYDYDSANAAESFDPAEQESCHAV